MGLQALAFLALGATIGWWSHVWRVQPPEVWPAERKWVTVDRIEDHSVDGCIRKRVWLTASAPPKILGDSQRMDVVKAEVTEVARDLVRQLNLLRGIDFIVEVPWDKQGRVHTFFWV